MNRMPLRRLALAALLALATLVPSPAIAVEPLGPTATEARLEAARVPAHDRALLAQRYLGLSPEATVPLVNAQPQHLQVGHVDTFWIGDQNTREYFQAEATLRLVMPHSYWYVANDVEVDEEGLRRAAEYFESTIYPQARRYFGSEPLPGIDNDSHVVIFNGRVPGVAGYYTSADKQRRAVARYSNEREAVYMNVNSVEPGTTSYNGTLAHEFTHLIHQAQNGHEETWIKEGTAELAHSVIVGTETVSTSSFLADPDIQLTAWAESASQALPHYMAAYLFMRYFMEQFGGPETMHSLLARDTRGEETFDQFLAERGDPRRFVDVFRDWVVANYLHDPAIAGGRYGYQGTSLGEIAVKQLPAPFEGTEETVSQFGADYYQIQGKGSFTLQFEGQDTVSLVGTSPHSPSAMWWSNRGDMADSRLTRAIDLTGVQKATLTFWAWYDIEPDYDYVYVSVSTDGGQTWKTLPGRHTTDTNPTGNNLGHGYTGISGGGDEPTWVEEQIDLTPYAGRSLLLRFEYVTDDSYNTQGFVLDDLAIPEIGWRDDGESDEGWQAEGWVRSDNLVPQRWAVQLIERRASGVTVQQVPVDESGKGSIVLRDLGGEVQQAVLVVSGVTSRTLQPARYRLSVVPAG